MSKASSIMCLITLTISTGKLIMIWEPTFYHNVTQPHSQPQGRKGDCFVANIAHILTDDIMKNRLGKDSTLTHVTKGAFKFPGKS